VTTRSPKLLRFEGNPIIKPRYDHWWESKATFNPAAIYENGKVHILYRAIGNSDVSVLGYAASIDGLYIKQRLDSPAYIPREPFEGPGLDSNIDDPQEFSGFVESEEQDDGELKGVYISGGGVGGGCEDPRLTRIDNRIYMTYVAYDGHGPPRIALTSIMLESFLAQDWQWKKPVLISAPGIVNKNACILPEKIESRYVIFHRIFPDILIDLVNDLDFDGTARWLKGEYKISPSISGWDSRKIGVGAPPIKTKDGWLLIYQAVGERDPGRYKIGAMLLDSKDPTKVLARLREPILEPTARYENEGWKRGVVYPCGAVLIQDRLFVYYGGADMVVCVATAEMSEFMAHLSKEGEVTPINYPVRKPPDVTVRTKEYIQGYCMKCRQKREIKNPQDIVLKNKRHAVQGICPKCGTKIVKFG
jgi:predicted GH43/DUF377 family glycosyl hydrolase